MLYTRVITDINEWKFQQKLNRALEEETNKGNAVHEIHFSTNTIELSSSEDTFLADPDLDSVTRYTALLIFCH